MKRNVLKYELVIENPPHSKILFLSNFCCIKMVKSPLICSQQRLNQLSVIMSYWDEKKNSPSLISKDTSGGWVRANKDVAAPDAKWRARPRPLQPVVLLMLWVWVCYGCCSSQPISSGVSVSTTDPERQWSISCVVIHHDNRFSSGRLIIWSWLNPRVPLPHPTHCPPPPNWANWVLLQFVFTYHHSRLNKP